MTLVVVADCRLVVVGGGGLVGRGWVIGSRLVRGGSIGLGLVLGVDGLALILDVSNVAIVMVRCVGDSLDAAVRKVDLVGASHGLAIRGLLGIEVGTRVVIVDTVLVGVRPGLLLVGGLGVVGGGGRMVRGRVGREAGGGGRDGQEGGEAEHGDEGDCCVNFPAGTDVRQKR